MDLEFVWWSKDVADYRERRERKEISLNIADRRAERDRLNARRKQRAAERKAAGLDIPPPAQADDGVQADERHIAADIVDVQDRHHDVMGKGVLVRAHPGGPRLTQK